MALKRIQKVVLISLNNTINCILNLIYKFFLFFRYYRNSQKSIEIHLLELVQDLQMTTYSIGQVVFYFVVSCFCFFLLSFLLIYILYFRLATILGPVSNIYIMYKI